MMIVVCVASSVSSAVANPHGNATEQSLRATPAGTAYRISDSGTHAPLTRSHTLLEHSSSVVQPRHACVARSQVPVGSAHWLEFRHPTQVRLSVVQYGV